MTDTFDSLRPMLETYLRERGIDPRKRFRCLNPEHFDHDPSMGYDSKRHKVHCFACGADYDLFDLLRWLKPPGDTDTATYIQTAQLLRKSVQPPSRKPRLKHSATL